MNSPYILLSPALRWTLRVAEVLKFFTEVALVFLGFWSSNAYCGYIRQTNWLCGITNPTIRPNLWPATFVPFALGLAGILSPFGSASALSSERNGKTITTTFSWDDTLDYMLWNDVCLLVVSVAAAVVELGGFGWWTEYKEFWSTVTNSEKLQPLISIPALTLVLCLFTVLTISIKSVHWNRYRQYLAGGLAATSPAPKLSVTVPLIPPLPPLSTPPQPCSPPAPEPRSPPLQHPLPDVLPTFHLRTINLDDTNQEESRIFFQDANMREMARNFSAMDDAHTTVIVVYKGNKAHWTGTGEEFSRLLLQAVRDRSFDVHTLDEYIWKSHMLKTTMPGEVTYRAEGRTTRVMSGDEWFRQLQADGLV